MMILSCILVAVVLDYGSTYTNHLYELSHLKVEDHVEVDCAGAREHHTVQVHKPRMLHGSKAGASKEPPAWTVSTIGTSVFKEKDPYEEYQRIGNRILFGPKIDREDASVKKMLLKHENKFSTMSPDSLAQYPNGKIMRAELYQNKTSVHLPCMELMHRGHLHLKLTNDYMQTAINAFSILLRGNLEDVLRLPSAYILRSARTIAMMKIAREKYAATWTVVKGDRSPEEITPRILELYRPLFKYLNGREMSRLNLSDDRILTYIGTHAELDRHQVGVVASAYIKLNPYWTEARYLNLMNNLLCGVPMNFMRRVSEHTYLQLTHQLFYHIHACDPLQRRFYYAMMTRTQALGKPYSWSARDVSRLGLLLSEIHGPDLASVNPEAMSGITSQVMLEIPAESLKHITEVQLRFIGQKPLNILAKRLRDYQEEQRIYGKAYGLMNLKYFTVFVFLVGVVMI